MAKKNKPEQTAPFPAVPKMGFWFKCDACSHCWIGAYLPMVVSDFVKLCKKPKCPMCASAKVVIAKQAAGVLFEKPAKKP